MNKFLEKFRGALDLNFNEKTENKSDGTDRGDVYFLFVSIRGCIRLIKIVFYGIACDRKAGYYGKRNGEVYV